MPISPGGFGLTAKAEVVTMTVVNNSTGQTQLSGSASFANKYNNPPFVVFGYFSQTISYVNVVQMPFEYSITTTGFSCQFNLPSGDTFGTGTMQAVFFVYGN